MLKSERLAVNTFGWNNIDIEPSRIEKYIQVLQVKVLKCRLCGHVAEWVAPTTRTRSYVSTCLFNVTAHVATHGNLSSWLRNPWSGFLNPSNPESPKHPIGCHQPRQSPKRSEQRHRRRGVEIK